MDGFGGERLEAGRPITEAAARALGKDGRSLAWNGNGSHDRHCWPWRYNAFIQLTFIELLLHAMHYANY